MLTTPAIDDLLAALLAKELEPTQEQAIAALNEATEIILTAFSYLSLIGDNSGRIADAIERIAVSFPRNRPDRG